MFLLYIEDDIRNCDRILPDKLFEYMGIKKPVLALVGDGVVKNTVTKSKIGFVAKTKDLSKIKKTYSLYTRPTIRKKLTFAPMKIL